MMQAFHNDPTVKAKYLARVEAHAKADNIIQGTGWENGRGCAIGCTLENYDHARYPIELGLPVWLAHLEDAIFEALPVDEAKTWPARFLAAIPVGANVEPVRHKLAMRRIDRLIEKQTANVGKHGSEIDAVITQALAALTAVRRCHEAEAGGAICAVTDWSAAESAARSAWSAARSAAESAAESAAGSAESAAWSAAESAAESAAWSAARSAWSAAWSAESAARSAWSAAWSAAESAAGSAAGSAESAAWSAAVWGQEASGLLELLSEASP